MSIASKLNEQLVCRQCVHMAARQTVYHFNAYASLLSVMLQHTLLGCQVK